jgi:hypothetical protein
MTELIFSLSGFAMASEPLNLRRPFAREQLGLEKFGELYGDAAWQKIRPYYANILTRHFRRLRPLPGQPFYRPLTWRTVIKENQGGGDHLGRVEDAFGCRIIHFLRHPVAVALSREFFPLLDDFGRCALRDHFNIDQLKLADRVISDGSHLEKGVLAWCLHHLPAFRNQRSSWFACTYEAMVLNAGEVLKELGQFLEAPEIEELAKVDRPSAVVRKSDPQTQKLLAQPTDRTKLVTKWQDRVSATELSGVQAILDAFAVKLYSADARLPHSCPDIFTDCGRHRVEQLHEGPVSN